MPASNTYDAIESVTLTSSVPTVTFGSIPQTYTDLYFVITSLGDSPTASINARFNSDSGSNYSVTRLYGNGTTAAGNRYTSQQHVQIGDYQLTSGSELPIYQFNVMNYSNSTTYKSTISRANVTNNWVSLQIGLWQSTAAITSVTFLPGGGNFISGSIFSLYGIKAA